MKATLNAAWKWSKSRLLPATKHDLDMMEKRMTENEQKLMNALVKIDGATTSIATNMQAEVTIQETISKEIDDLVTALKNAGVSQELVDKAEATGTKLEASSAAIEANIPVLQAIAAKGASNPVPVPVPPPSEVPPAETPPA